MDRSILDYNINRFLSQTGCLIFQRNGQRFCQTPKALGEAKHLHKGYEVFVAKLPRNCYENEIYPMFSKAGDICEIRLMMDFSGSNRGFCYVKYFKHQSANMAVDVLNNKEIRPGHRVAVRKSIERSTLLIYFGGKEVNEITAAEELRKTVENMTEVRIFGNGVYKEARIEFDCHVSATKAIKNCSIDMERVFGPDAYVTWCQPITSKEIHKHRMLKKILCSKNLQENRCPNSAYRDLLLSAGRCRQRNDLFHSPNNEYSGLAYNSLTENGNQTNSHVQFNDLQGGKQYLFNKMFSMPEDDSNKQCDTVDNATFAMNNPLAGAYTDVNEYFQSLWNSTPEEDDSNLGACALHPDELNERKNLDRIHCLPKNFFKMTNGKLICLDKQNVQESSMSQSNFTTGAQHCEGEEENSLPYTTLFTSGMI